MIQAQSRTLLLDRCTCGIVFWMICLVLLFPLSIAAQQGESLSNEIPLYSTADEFSARLDSLKSSAGLAPIAEVTVPGGGKWYLVKSEGGVVGWIKADTNDDVKKIASRFKPVPTENATMFQGSTNAEASGIQAAGKTTVPVNARGSLVVVPVTLNGNFAVKMYLDTGAGRTLISKRVARELRLPSLGSAVGYGVGGAVTMPITKLASIRVGEAEVTNLETAIHDFPGAPSVDGLLGFDFLRYFSVALDAQKQLLDLTPRK